MNDVFNGLGVLVAPLDREEFLKVRETLTRVGTTGKANSLHQTCFVLHKRGQYAIMHHLEMRMMDGENVDMGDDDVAHRNSVAGLLDQWGLVQLDDPEEVEAIKGEPGSVTVIPYKDKEKYTLVPYYQIGKPAR